MQRAAGAIVAALVVAGLGAAVFATSIEAPREAFGVEVDVAPWPEAEDVYECRVVVTDLTSGEVLVAPTIRFRRGEEGSVQSGSQEGLLFTMTVSVDPEGETASYASDVRRGGEPVHAQAVTVRLVS